MRALRTLVFLLEGVPLCPPLHIAPKYEDWTQTQLFPVQGKSLSRSAENFFLAQFLMVSEKMHELFPHL